MINEFDGDTHNDYVAWLKAHLSDGYIWNVGKAALHRASCRHVQASEIDLANDKIKRISARRCSDTKQELVAAFPDAQSDKARCAACSP